MLFQAKHRQRLCRATVITKETVWVLSWCHEVSQNIAISKYFNICHHISALFDIAFFNIFQRVATYLKIIQHISVCFNIFSALSTRFHHSSTHFNIAHHIWTYFNIFNIFQHITKGSSSGATLSCTFRSKGEGGQPRCLIIQESTVHLVTSPNPPPPAHPPPSRPPPRTLTAYPKHCTVICRAFGDFCMEKIVLATWWKLRKY